MEYGMKCQVMILFITNCHGSSVVCYSTVLICDVIFLHQLPLCNMEGCSHFSCWNLLHKI